MKHITQDDLVRYLYNETSEAKSDLIREALKTDMELKEVFNALKKHGVLGDWREPDVIRVAPVPLYNTFEDVYQFGQILKHLTDVQA